MPDRIQLSRAKDFRLPEGAVSVARPTRWGNLFWPGQRVIVPGAYGAAASPYHGCRATGKHGTGPRGFAIRRVRDRADAVALFIDYIRHDSSGWPPGEIGACLGGRPLACWCPLPAPGEPDICHAAALLALANGRRMATPPVPQPGGGTQFTVQRCCNGCGLSLGDVTLTEIARGVAGRPLPDVRGECPHCTPTQQGVIRL